MRSVLGRFATGVTVVAVGGEAPSGMTANAFTSVSLEPPLILICVSRKSALCPALQESGEFAVSMLSADQEDVARYFADHSRPRGEAEFGPIRWSPGPATGAPVLAGALAWLDCAVTASYDGGDHTIFLSSVLASGAGSVEDALVFFGGDFHRPRLSAPEQLTIRPPRELT
nr:flavin reductase family protein [Streptomyces sp. SID13031]